MKKLILFLITFTTVALASSATKIYVCGEKITGTTSFSVGNGTVSYNNNTRTLTIYNVEYEKSGSSNNGISVDEVDGPLSIVLTGVNKFTIKGADTFLFKSKKKTTMTVQNGITSLYCESNDHAAIKLQDSDLAIEGLGTLKVYHNETSNSQRRAIKGGSGTENITFQIKNCFISSREECLYHLNSVTMNPTGDFVNGGYSYEYSGEIRFDTRDLYGSTKIASDVNHWYSGTGMKIFGVLYYDSSGSYDYSFTSNNLHNQSIDNLETLGNQYGVVVINDINAVAVFDLNSFPDAQFREYLYEQFPSRYIMQNDVDRCTFMNVGNRQISNLKGIEYFSKLKTLYCNDNLLTSLPTLPGALETLNCSNNKFTTLEIVGKSNLHNLVCSNNKSLTNLVCSQNALESLNLSSCTYLVELDCSQNNLSELSVQDCVLLAFLNCSENHIAAPAMASLINTLRTIPANSKGKLYVIGIADKQGNGNVITESQIRAANKKNWVAYQYIKARERWLEMGIGLQGDVNGDGKVNVSDVSALINMILGITPIDIVHGDVNGDGRVNVSDVSALINIILNIQ